jgi:hypothetical protein
VRSLLQPSEIGASGTIRLPAPPIRLKLGPAMKPVCLVVLGVALFAACGAEPGAPPDAAPARDASTPADAPRPVDVPPADAALSPDAAAASDGASGPPPAPEPGSPAEILHNVVFAVSCPMGMTGDSCEIPDAQRNKTSDPILFGGDAATTYRVKLRFCGAVEPREYRNCQSLMGGGRFCPGGQPDSSGSDADTRPTYELKVSAPARSYFLNNHPLVATAIKIDYSAEIEVQGNATITLATASRLPTTLTARSGGPHTCPYVPRIEQPYAGQFIHVVVESVLPPQ